MKKSRETADEKRTVSRKSGRKVSAAEHLGRGRGNFRDRLIIVLIQTKGLDHRLVLVDHDGVLGLGIDLPTLGSLLASAVDGHINSLDLVGGRESLELFTCAGLVIIERDEISDRTLGISGNLIDSPDQTGQVFTYLARENRDGGFSAAYSYICLLYTSPSPRAS